MNLVTRLKRSKAHLSVFYNLIRLSVNPQNTDNALAVSDRLLELGYFENGVDYLLADGRTSGLVQNPYSIAKYDLDKMLKFPPKSLGYQLAATMKANNLDPNYFRRSNPDVKGKVILDHIEQTHDIWHIVLNFDTSEAGEVGVLSFEFCQLRAPQAVVFMGAAFFRCLYKDISALPGIMDAMVRGWDLGRKWPPFFSIDWNGIMHLPVESIRFDLDNGLIPGNQ